MQPPYIPVGETITAAWLTEVLRANGTLTSGAVLDVSITSSSAFNSATSFLQVRYSADAPADAPRQLVCKRNIAEAWGVEAGAEEAHFYRCIAEHPDHPPVIIPCYAASYDPASGNSYVLLQDLSATHTPPLTRDQQMNNAEAMPTEANIAHVVDTLAAVHAYWWNHPAMEQLGFTIGYWTRDQDRFDQYLARRTRSWEALITDEADWFPADYRALYEHLLQRLPHYWATHLQGRFAARRHLSLIHGDAYFANFLTPRAGTVGQTYLLDWQSPGFDIAAADLVNLCATFWTPQQRHAEQRETRVLARYLATLHAHGVMDYTKDDLRRDYQHGLIDWVLMPVQDRFGGSDRAYWWPKMQHLVAAYRDWDCAALLA